MAIATQQFPSWYLPPETYALSCLLHDLAATSKNIKATLLSFEFYGGMLSLSLLKERGAPIAQAESVAEAVIRHQDLGTEGTLTTITQILQLATIFGEQKGDPNAGQSEYSLFKTIWEGTLVSSMLRP